MKYFQIFLVGVAAVFMIFISGLVIFYSGAVAASPTKIAAKAAGQTTGDRIRSVSISSMAFMPVDQDIFYNKDTARQILTLRDQNRPVAGSNSFVAPLTLPDRGRLVGMSVFGEDFDSQGVVRVRLKRCDHSQARCINLAEISSAENYAGGLFDTGRVSITTGTIVDNNVYSYILEMELAAIFNSGLRSVRLELVEPGEDPEAPSGNLERWALSGSTTRFPLPNPGWAEVRICTDDLSHLDNTTHYPMLVVDGETTVLSSTTCVTVSGFDIELRRNLNTGPSSGTYQFLR